MFKKKVLNKYLTEKTVPVDTQSSVIKHTGPASTLVGREETRKEYVKPKQIETNGHIIERDQIPQTKETNNTPVPESSHGDDYNDQSKFVAQVLAGPEIQQKELKILTPPPENSYPLDNDDGYYPMFNDSRRDSNESDQSFLSNKSTKGKRPKQPGKDERLASQKGIDKFISTYDIINIPMDEFNDQLEKFRTQGMTEEQAVTARDIRRRGKNKNAAQMCRKRANERIKKLNEEVKSHKRKKIRLEIDCQHLDEELSKESKQNDNLSERILNELNMDTKHWMLENDYKNSTVTYKKICPEFNQETHVMSKPDVFTHEQQQSLQLPRTLPYSRERIYHHNIHRPIAQVVLEKVPPNHHIPHRPPYYPFGLAYHHNQPSVSLFPVMPQGPVSLYPVPRYSIPGPRYGPVSLSHERNIDFRDRSDYRRQLEIRPYRTFPTRVIQSEETIIKEEIPQDLTMSDK